jgi:hypothetical protein
MGHIALLKRIPSRALISICANASSIDVLALHGFLAPVCIYFDRDSFDDTATDSLHSDYVDLEGF